MPKPDDATCREQIRATYEKACRQVCELCSMEVGGCFDAWNEWGHAAFTTETGVDIPPQPCHAANIRALMRDEGLL